MIIGPTAFKFNDYLAYGLHLWLYGLRLTFMIIGVTAYIYDYLAYGLHLWLSGLWLTFMIIWFMAYIYDYLAYCWRSIVAHW